MAVKKKDAKKSPKKVVKKHEKKEVKKHVKKPAKHVVHKKHAEKKHEKKIEKKPEKKEKHGERKPEGKPEIREEKKIEKKHVIMQKPEKIPEKKPEKKKKKGIIFTIGKRKKAVARAVIRPGSGVVLFNGEPVENMRNEILRLRLKEPLLLMKDVWKGYDFIVNVKGGGIFGQIDAARQSIARGLVEIFGPEIRQKFLDYDRSMLVYDPRRTEPHKPPRSSQGPRRYKQRSKR
jgi:small subunit ribosomal protein S9